jgi:hypothetical protein
MTPSVHHTTLKLHFSRFTFSQTVHESDELLYLKSLPLLALGSVIAMPSLTSEVRRRIVGMKIFVLEILISQWSGHLIALGDK